MRRIRRAGIEASLTDELAAAWLAALDDWEEGGNSSRLWRRDASLWTDADEDGWLGWLEPGQACDVGAIDALGGELHRQGFRHIVVLGMGGSSLGVELLTAAGKAGGDGLGLQILDSIDPDQVRRVETDLDLDSTLFIVASKSGSTLETRVLADYFFERMVRRHPGAGRHFVAITDRGSSLDRHAADSSYRHTFYGVSAIGGRFSVLSPFGLVPLGLSGGDIDAVIDGARAMAAACGPEVAARDSHAVGLGILLGVLPSVGVQRLPIVTPPGLEALGDWIEQLVAESTGKEGRGLLPIIGAGTPRGSMERRDRLWVSWPSSGEAAERLMATGESVVVLPAGGRRDVGGEIFRWQMATAVAASLLSVHGFLQPDVESSKKATRDLISEYDGGDFLPQEREILVAPEWRLFASPPLESRSRDSAETIVRAHLGDLEVDEFVALLAWMDRSAGNLAQLDQLRSSLARATGADVSLGLGPRYLHSTGQYFKGGPNRGRFLQITCEKRAQLDIPGRPYGFAELESAQARGDFDVLAERGRRVLQVHLLGDPAEGLVALCRLVERALDHET